MPDEDSPAPVLAERIHALIGESDGDEDTITLSRDEVSRLMDVAEKAHALLVNAYSMPADEQGVRLKSEDAVRLQWALRRIGVGDGDGSGQSSFTV